MELLSRLPLALPARTLRLFRQFWLPLLVWYLLGRGLHDGLLETAAHVNRHNGLAAYSVVATAILCSLASYVFMFHAVERGLPTIWRIRLRRAEDDPTVSIGGRRRVREHLGDVGRALLPFLLVYAAWALFLDDVRTVEYRTWELEPFGGAPDKASFTWWFAGAAVVAWLLVKVCEGVTRRTGNAVTAAFAAVFEANWIFFVIFGIQDLWKGAVQWLANTTAGHGVADVLSLVHGLGAVLPIRVSQWLDALTFDFGTFEFLQDPFKDGVILPFCWLAIAAVCYGREMETLRGIVDKERFARLVQRLDRRPEIVKRHEGWLFRGYKEKYYPILQAVRLLLRATLPALLFFCALYSLLDLGGSVLNEALATAIGPHDSGSFWQEYQPLVGIVADVPFEMLRICLLAATFDLAMSSYRAVREEAARADEEPAAAPSPV